MDWDEEDDEIEITSTLRYSDEENFAELDNPLEEEEIEDEEYQTEEEIDETEENDQREDEKEQTEEERERDDSLNCFKKPSEEPTRKGRKRNLLEIFTKRFDPLINQDSNDLTNSVRMSRELFDKILQNIESDLKKTGSACVPPKFRLYITLNYLAHGTHISTIANQFGVAHTTIISIIHDTCKYLWKALNQWNIPTLSKKQWKDISFEIENKWKLPFCVGAAGKDQFNIRGPPLYGSFTLILFATCDIHYSITGFDLGTFRGDTCTNLAWETNYYNKLYNNELDLPDSGRPPNSTTKLHYYFAVEKTLSLKKHLIMSYNERKLTKDQQNFNNRIQEACRYIENTFGVLRARWQVLLSQMIMRRDAAMRVFKTIIALHNFLLKYEPTYCPPKYVDHYKNGELIEGLWRKEVLKSVEEPIKLGSNSCTKFDMKVRDDLMMYTLKTYDQQVKHNQQLAEALLEEVQVEDEVEVQQELEEQEEVLLQEEIEMKIETFFEDVEHFVLGSS